ncbi:hypothetical protein KY312_03770 [Candidatus Woesearchaeota archaeon]|nr:hypothetical protein [Candidatus Woesearchaeota archaeon]
MGTFEAFRVSRFKRRFLKLMPELKKLELPNLSDDERYRIMRDAYNLLREITDYVINTMRLSEAQEDELIKVALECKKIVRRSPRFKEVWEYAVRHVA